MTSPPRVVVIAGPNGAGKSTLAPFLLRDELQVGEFVNADTIAQGLSAFAPEQVAFAAGRLMLARLRALADTATSFAFETTLATRSYAPWLRTLAVGGYEINLVFLWLRSADLAVKRVQQRVRLGGHQVPEDVVRRRYARGVRNFRTLYSQVATNWVLLDNSDVSGASVIAEGGAGKQTTVAQSDLWKRFEASP